MRRTELMKLAHAAGCKVTQDGNQTRIARGCVAVRLYETSIVRDDKGMTLDMLRNMTVTEAAQALKLI